ncbi:MAG: PstS family phosphate ABC transporter substrate-binding protein [Planctomycetaceae bacterium]
MQKSFVWASCLGVLGIAVLAGVTGCKKRGERITITVDGSSTVYPITQAVAEDYQKEKKDVKVTVGTSGTGGGFKKFVLGETDINNASRPIKQKEIDACKKNGIEYLELKVAIDGLSVVVNKENTWCDSLSVEQLKKLWEPGSKVKNWQELDKNYPDKPIKLYGPDSDSGTFDYFTEVICGKSGASRNDYQPSTNDNVLVKGVSGDEGALGYFGYAYYIKNKDKLKVVKISSKETGGTAIEPNDETIEGGKYVPLSRPLFLYVNKAKLKRPEVVDFLRYYLGEKGQDLVGEAGYVRLSKSVAETVRKKFEDAVKEAGGGEKKSTE